MSQEFDVTRQFSLSPSSIDADNMTMRVVFATETPVIEPDAHRGIVDAVIMPAGLQFPTGNLPFLCDHNPGVRNCIGSVVDIAPSAAVPGGLEGTVRFMSGDSEAFRVFNLYQEGHLNAVSVRRIGFYQDAEYIAPGKSREINGRMFTASKERWMRIEKSARAVEVSAVTIPADTHARVRQKEMIMEPNVSPDNASGGTPENQLDNGRAVNDAVATALAAERARIAGIADVARGLEGVTSEHINKATTEGMTVDQARALFSGIALEVLRAQRQEPVARPNIHVGDEGRTLEFSAIRAAVQDNLGLPVTDDERKSIGAFAGMRLMDAARAIARIETGHDVYDRGKLWEVCRASQFTNLLSDSANKTLAASMPEATANLAWVARRYVPTFLDYKDINLSPFANLEALQAGGKLQRDTVSEWYETMKTGTRGKQFLVTREMFINDQLGGFLRAVGDFGAVVRNTEADMVYNKLTENSGVGPLMNRDSKYLFATDRVNPNYATGTDTVLSFDSLAAARKLLMKAQIKAGTDTRRLNIMGRYLIVPAALLNTAEQLAVSPTIVMNGGSSKVTMGVTNTHAGKFTPIADARLDELTTEGATAWYLAADPLLHPTIALVYLEGTNGMPQISGPETDRDTLGLVWSIYHDCAAACVGDLGIVRMKGAS